MFTNFVHIYFHRSSLQWQIQDGVLRSHSSYKMDSIHRKIVQMIIQSLEKLTGKALDCVDKMATKNNSNSWGCKSYRKSFRYSSIRVYFTSG